MGLKFPWFKEHNCTKAHQTALQFGLTILHIPTNKILLPFNLGNICDFPTFIFFANQEGVKWYLKTVLICIFLIICIHVMHMAFSFW